MSVVVEIIQSRSEKAPYIHVQREVISDFSWHEVMYDRLNRPGVSKNALNQLLTVSKRLTATMVGPREMYRFHEAIGVTPDIDNLGQLANFIEEIIPNIDKENSINLYPVVQIPDKSEPKDSFLSVGDGTKLVQERRTIKDRILEFWLQNDDPQGDIWLPEDRGIVVAKANRPVTTDMLINLGSIIVNEAILPETIELSPDTELYIRAFKN